MDRNERLLYAFLAFMALIVLAGAADSVTKNMNMPCAAKGEKR
jgi:hypothetical protein